MKKDSNKKEKKHLFGRNLITLITIVLVALIATSVYYSIDTYKKEKKANEVTPYVSNNGTLSSSGTDEVQYLKESEFTDYNLIFYCKNYNEAGKSAEFSITLTKKPKPEDSNEATTYYTSSVKVMVCLAADWVNFCEYSQPSTINLKDTNSVNRLITVRNLINFPAKNKNVWPFGKTVDSPDAYLYLDYTIDTVTHKQIIIKYTYSQYCTEKTTGAR